MIRIYFRHSDVQRNPVDVNTVTEPKSFDLKTVDENTPRGEKDIWAQVDPVWKFTHEELVEYMSRRVIYQTGKTAETENTIRQN